jgi:hypothetical protein
MHLLFPVLLLVLSAAAPAPTAGASRTMPSIDCPEAASHFARQGSVWRSEPVKPKKLAELPPAETFAAVYRRDERGCIVPVKYRGVRR